MMDIANLMGKVDSADMTAGGVFLLPGDFKLKIREVKNGEAKSQGWPFFLAEFEIVASTNPDRQVGSVVQWMVPFKEVKYEATYLGNVKNFLWAAFNGFDPTVTPDQITAKVWAIAVGEAQPLRDRYIAATAVSREKKNSPGEYTRVTFSPWSPDAA